MDANAAAMGEAWLGAARDKNTFIYVTVGTGIGGSLFIDGRLIRGIHHCAGEIGHTILIPNGPLCGCGKHGCLEALASGLAIARKGEAALLLGRTSALRQVERPVTAQHVVEAARQGDALAVEILNEAAYFLEIGLANLLTLYDPEMIVLGGGIMFGAFDLLKPEMQRSIQQNLNYWAPRDTPVILGQLGEMAGLLGAARAALELVEHHH